ncbi:cobalt ECF transporter T component CbiQ [Dermatobacter hominis]|uniref:cobalt ECF transporter T component CbiQ n=1 Tax=Dermatobacter hominis TaxID=2884263 RepID=UPI001D111323|nr:cobalt ECF transporter T component CbiQ [Dermatobacter hominis]UDY34374.1 cobalt ECF transporter T component CbiQ [Dermatobacter hominis]
MAGRHPPGGLHRLARPGSSPVHRLPPEAKLAGLVTFVAAVAVTPRHAVGALALDGAVLAAVVAIAGLPVRTVLARLAVVAPFVLVALAIPFVAHGPTTDIAGVALSIDGLWATWNVVAKATLGAGAAIVVSATTPLPELLEGMARLHVPRVVVAIVSSMVRYLDLLVAQVGRTRRAMAARGHDPRWLWQVGPFASSLGLLFVRSYERGERVHLAMVARGFTGTVPLDARPPAPAGRWAVAVAPGAVAVAAVLAWSVLR